MPQSAVDGDVLFQKQQSRNDTVWFYGVQDHRKSYWSLNITRRLPRPQERLNKGFHQNGKREAMSDFLDNSFQHFFQSLSCSKEVAARENIVLWNQRAPAALGEMNFTSLKESQRLSSHVGITLPLTTAAA